MALRLQFLSLVVPRAAFARCRGLPSYFLELRPSGGILFETTWYDTHLWCETFMDGAEEAVATWEARGLRAAGTEGTWMDLCLATAQQGPLGPCPWLSYHPDTQSLSLSGSVPGPVIGGIDHLRSLQVKLAQAEAAGEAAYDRMYGGRRPKDEYEEASLALSQAADLAAFLHQPGEVGRIQARLEHMRSVYQSQFRG